MKCPQQAGPTARPPERRSDEDGRRAHGLPGMRLPTGDVGVWEGVGVGRARNAGGWGRAGKLAGL